MSIPANIKVPNMTCTCRPGGGGMLLVEDASRIARVPTCNDCNTQAIGIVVQYEENNPILVGKCAKHLREYANDGI